MIVGLIVTGVALVTIVALVLLGRRSINRIAADGFGSARKIVRNRRSGR